MATTLPVSNWGQVRQGSAGREKATDTLCKLFRVTKGTTAGDNLVGAFEQHASALVVPTMMDNTRAFNAFVLANARRKANEHPTGQSLDKLLETDPVFCAMLAQDATTRASEIQREQRGDEKPKKKEKSA